MHPFRAVLPAVALTACAVAQPAPTGNVDLDSVGMSTETLYQRMQWPKYCNRGATTHGGGEQAQVVLTGDGQGGGALTVVCTPGLTLNCGLVYPVKLDEFAAVEPLEFYQVVETDSGNRLVKDKWVCGRGGVTVPPGTSGRIAFEQSVGPGGCGLVNVYDIRQPESPMWPTAVYSLSCALPEVHQRKQQGIEYASAYEWPELDDFRSLPTTAPFVEEQWFPEIRTAQ